MIKVAQETQNAWGFNIQKIRSYKYADKLFNSPHTVRRSAMYSYRRPIAIIAIRLICNIHSHSFFCDIQKKPILIILSHLFCLKTLIFKVERSPMNPVLKTKSHSHNWKISQQINLKNPKYFPSSGNYHIETLRYQQSWHLGKVRCSSFAFWAVFQSKFWCF